MKKDILNIAVHCRTEEDTVNVIKTCEHKLSKYVRIYIMEKGHTYYVPEKKDFFTHDQIEEMGCTTIPASEFIAEYSDKKKYPIGGFAPGNYWCKCSDCKERFQGDKRAVQCEPCAVKSFNPQVEETSILGEWTLWESTTALGNTGDYMTSSGITNGSKRLHLEVEEDFSEEELQEICNKLNSSLSSPPTISDEEIERMAYAKFPKGQNEAQEHMVAGLRVCFIAGFKAALNYKP